MSMSDMSSMSMGANCVLTAPRRTALDLTNAEIRGLLRLDESATVEGTIRLAGAVIHGTLALHGKMNQPEHLSLVGGSAMTVDGEVYLEGLRTDGGMVNFRGATLGRLSAKGAQLSNPDGYSLSLEQSTVWPCFSYSSPFRLRYQPPRRRCERRTATEPCIRPVGH